MSVRRLSLLPLLLALALLFAQQRLVAHELVHDFERMHASKDAMSSDDAFCAQCLVLGSIGHANGSASLRFLPVFYAPPRVAFVHRDGVAARRLPAYRSRAPPPLS